MSAMDRWIMAVSSDLGLDPGAADARAILDMTRDVAHNVDRPAAPVTAYLIGVAVGRGMPLSSAVKRVRGLAVGWPGRTEESLCPGGTPPGPPLSPAAVLASTALARAWARARWAGIGASPPSPAR